MKQTITFPQQKAATFYDAHLVSSFGSISSANDFKDSLWSELNFFKRQNDKYEFLLFLMKLFKNENNRQTALHFGHTTEELDAIIFITEQEIEEISESLERIEKKSDKLSGAEQSDISDRIDQIIEELKKTHAGQEVLFEEINELRGCMDLGKKKFNQLVVGKLVEMTVSSVIDKAVGIQIYESLGKPKRHRRTHTDIN